MELRLTADVTAEDKGYVAWCPEFDVTSQGATEREALAGLREAVERLLDDMNVDEIARRYQRRHAGRTLTGVSVTGLAKVRAATALDDPHVQAGLAQHDAEAAAGWAGKDGVTAAEFRALAGAQHR